MCDGNRKVRYLFEDLGLDTERRELRRRADLVPLEPQVFDLLVFLIQNRQRVVSKDDLLAAVWEGRIVSESALTTRINALRHAIGDSGGQQRLIKTLLRKGIRFVGEVREEKGRATEGAMKPPQLTEQTAHQSPKTVSLLPLPDKPSIAVLPFINISGDPEQEYFVDGIVEDITTALSHFRWLFVIARSSSFTFKGRAIDVKQVGRELGVRYVLEGSVRKVANRLRISAQLIDALTGMHLWADRFDGALEDIFDLQDRVTASVVGAIAPKLEQVEIERAKRKPTENLDAYDYYLRGMASLHLWTKDSNDEALQLFYRAFELDPGFASAYGMAAWCFVARNGNGWMGDRAQAIAQVRQLAWKALDLGADDASALSAGGYALVFVVHDVASGAAYVDQALTLNPNLASALVSRGWTKAFLGEPHAAIKDVTSAMRLSPLDPLRARAHGAIAFAHFIAGRYDEASLWAEKASREGPNYLPGIRDLAAANALAGRHLEAQKAMARLRALDPALRISAIKDWIPIRRPDDLARLIDGLRKAGLPE
jgi:TolB-like protein